MVLCLISSRRKRLHNCLHQVLRIYLRFSLYCYGSKMLKNRSMQNSYHACNFIHNCRDKMLCLEQLIKMNLSHTRKNAMLLVESFVQWIITAVEIHGGTQMPHVGLSEHDGNLNSVSSQCTRGKSPIAREPEIYKKKKKKKKWHFVSSKR